MTNKEILKWVNNQMKDRTALVSRSKCLNYIDTDIATLQRELKILNQIRKDFENKEPILDDAERRYLKNIIRPFKDSCSKVVKRKCFYNENQEFLFIDLQDKGKIMLPYFQQNTMYKNMETNKNYTLKELGIDYE